MLTRRSFATLLGGAPAAFAAKASKKCLVYFGTYTRNGSQGIYVSRLDAASGNVSEPELAAEIANPSFVALHPNGKHLYSVTETGPAGIVTSFNIHRDSGKLTKLNSTPSKGTGPCHLNVDKTGHTLVVANYNSGSVAALPVNADGSLGESASFIQHKGSSADPRRQQGPHAHSVNISSDGRYVICADLGMDQVLVYKFDAAKSTLTANDPPFASVKPGSGPRHFTFHPNGKYAYVINEMLSTVTAFQWDASRGVLKELHTISTLPADFKGNNSTAEVVAHSNGKFLYGSNRGHNSLAVFSIGGDGRLKHLGNVSTQGEVPRNFAIEPGGKWLLAANQNTNNVVGFSIDATGMPKPTGQTLKVGAPVCVRYLAI
ncbi:MAG TPA: lactonase family protein [Bryobacteraceae bacterium]|nr:lactonase family protein [Bryobacteraceae bacterium]